MHLHYGDLTDSTCLVKIVSEVKPDEIYNLGAQSHVKVSKKTCVSASHTNHRTIIFSDLYCIIKFLLLFLDKHG